jgi:hypothetical protein
MGGLDMGGGAASGRASAEKSMETGEFHLLLREIKLLLLDTYGTAPILSAVLSSAATAATVRRRRRTRALRGKEKRKRGSGDNDVKTNARGARKKRTRGESGARRA